jgi:hypothetical protein
VTPLALFALPPFLLCFLPKKPFLFFPFFSARFYGRPIESRTQHKGDQGCTVDEPTRWKAVHEAKWAKDVGMDGLLPFISEGGGQQFGRGVGGQILPKSTSDRWASEGHNRTKRDASHPPRSKRWARTVYEGTRTYMLSTLHAS